MGPWNPTLSIGFDQVGREVHVDMIVTFFLHIIEIWMYWIFGFLAVVVGGCSWLAVIDLWCFFGIGFLALVVGVLFYCSRYIILL